MSGLTKSSFIFSYKSGLLPVGSNCRQTGQGLRKGCEDRRFSSSIKAFELARSSQVVFLNMSIDEADRNDGHEEERKRGADDDDDPNDGSKRAKKAAENTSQDFIDHVNVTAESILRRVGK